MNQKAYYFPIMVDVSGRAILRKKVFVPAHVRVQKAEDGAGTKDPQPRFTLRTID